MSETTIYRGAVPMQINETPIQPTVIQALINKNDNEKRFSSSSDEVDTSDDMIDQNVRTSTLTNNQLLQDSHEFTLFKQFLDYRLKEQRDAVTKHQDEQQAAILDEPQPSTSTGRRTDDRMKSLVQQAERAKARMYQVPGKSSSDEYERK